jgi:hypothetical protein
MSVNFSNTVPAAPAGNTNVLWQNDGSGNISAYVPTGASIVTSASVDLTAQAANVGATTLLAATASGFYRVCSYAVVTQVPSTSSTLPKVTITWTDPNNSTGETKDITGTVAGAPANALTDYAQGVLVFNAKTGTNIQYATSGYASVGGTAMQYALSIRLEKL